MRKKPSAVSSQQSAIASADECDAAILEIGAIQRRLQALETEMNEAIAAVKEGHERAADGYREAMAARTASVKSWCEANRDALTNGGKVKFYRFGSGEVAWRARPAKVVFVRRAKAETVIDWLLQAGPRFRRFLRVKHRLNKEAMLEAPEIAAEIPGVRIGSGGEDFAVKPFATELEVVS